MPVLAVPALNHVTLPVPNLDCPEPQAPTSQITFIGFAPLVLVYILSWFICPFCDEAPPGAPGFLWGFSFLASEF